MYVDDGYLLVRQSEFMNVGPVILRRFLPKQTESVVNEQLFLSKFIFFKSLIVNPFIFVIKTPKS
jgi:hypothetical protein